MKTLLRGLDRFFPFLVPMGLLIGILFGENTASLSDLVPWVFGGVTFIGSLKMDFNSFKETLTHPLPIGLTLLVLRVILPVLALMVGYVVFPTEELTRMGLLLFALIPTGINSTVWALMYKGNLSLSLSVILIDTLFSPFILPLSLAFLTDTTVQLDAFGMMMSLIRMIVIPSLLGMLVNQFTKGEFPNKWSPRLLPLSKIGLIFVVFINGGTVAPYFRTIDERLLIIMATVFTLAVSGFAISWGLARLGQLTYANTVSTVFNGGMRNNSTGIVIAIAYFPPEAAIPVITGILFQQVICAMVGTLLAKKELYFRTLDELRAATT